MALEISSLPNVRNGVRFFSAYGTSAFVRLSLDPQPQPSGTMHRTMAVNWLARPGGIPAQNLSRDIGWADLPQSVHDDSVTWKDTKSTRTITEEAAIGVMALLIRDLERVTIRRVVEVGGGGDYHIELEDGAQSQVECSGVYIDEHGYESNERLKQKSQQVLTHSADGFAVVVTFARTATQEAHCYLHFVTPATIKPRTKRKKPKKPGGKK